MANKQLTAKVRLNTTQAERSIDNLVKKINKIDNAINKTKKATTATNQVTNATSRWANEQKKVNTLLRSSNGSLGLIRSKLKSIADTYLGVMGMKAVIGTSDMLTSAENKLNYTSAQSLGAKGMNADGSYSTETLNATQDAMDKMYVSSQKVRMGYDDMMSNVSKSMALAGDAFDNNTDKAIRFQEIMAEAYAVGGASQQEMSSSMYQMIQALGSGVLAGDELRSVREGAPLAYKAIEEFAQGVYNCKDSLKDMASDGMITSEMVVAAIMNAGNAMDTAFAQTEQTFAQTWTQIKNVAIRSFMPMAKMLRTALNDAIDSGLIEKAEVVFSNIAKAIMIVFTVIKNVIVWIADNWEWLQHVVIAVIGVMITAYILKSAIAIQCAIAEIAAWIAANAAMLPTILIVGAIVLAILALIYVFYLWKTASIDTCTAILIGLGIVAIAIMLIGLITHSTTVFIIGLVLGGIVLVANNSSNLCEFIYNLAMGLAQAIIAILFVVLAVYIATGTIMLSIPMLIALFIVGLIAALLAVFIQFTGQIVGGAYGIANVFKAVCHNIGIFFSNLWYAATAAFWNFIGDILSGIASLEPAFNAIAELFGLEGVTLSGLTQDAYAKASAAESNIQDYNSISGAWDSGYAEGYAIGEGIQNTINGFGDKIKNLGSLYQIDGSFGDNLLASLGDKLGLDFSNFSNFPTNSVDDYGDLLNGIGGDAGDIKDGVDKISDELDLTKEDLEYLRKVAEMEWKKEYTTANITVDMSNYNTINGEADLDGIVSRLSDKLYEEMNIVANGVYVY